MQLPDPGRHEGAEGLLTAIHKYIEAAQQALAADNMADLSGLDAVVDTLCARVAAMKDGEGKAFTQQLGQLHTRLGELQLQMEETKRRLEEEVKGLNTRQRASRAYRKDKP